MEIFLIFINPKKVFVSIRNKNIIFKTIPVYFILFTILITFLLKKFERNLFYGAILQLSFNVIFLIFIALFIKVFVKLFGVERKFNLFISDTLLINLPSFLLFFILVVTNFNLILNFSYGLIPLFSYNQGELFKKALFFFYYPPRILLFLYSILGIRFIYNLSLKRSFVVTILVYFIIFVVYLF